VIRAMVDIHYVESLKPSSVILCFEALPRVGECLEVDLETLGITDFAEIDKLGIGWSLNGRRGLSLTVRSIYWQPDNSGENGPVMLPVLNVESWQSKERT